MFQGIRRRFNATSLVAVLALVFAMSGGAWAASRYVITSTKQIKPSVLKSLKGANGKSGANGANGAPGAAGPVGPKGENGTNGTNGTNGVTGPTGVTGSGAPGVAGPTGPTGAGGMTGPTGPTGESPNTLSPGKIETGTYVAYINDLNQINAKVSVAISFPIPVEGGVTSKAYYLEPGEKNSECEGTFETPEASPGVLCIYAFETTRAFLHVEPTPEQIVSAANTPYGLTGSRIKFAVEGEPNVTSQELEEHPGYIHTAGTWAVTAPTTP